MLLKTLRDELSDTDFEPTRLQDLLLGAVETALENDAQVLDPSQPYPFLMEANVVLTASYIHEDYKLTRKQYPVLAQSEEELFIHLTDKQLEGMYSTPASGWFYIYIAKDELLRRAVDVGQTGTKKITIPKHSRITVNNATFTLQYPVNFIVKTYGGIDVIYDISRPSPLQKLPGNKVEWDIVTLRGVTEGQDRTDFVRVHLPLKQMLLSSYTFSPSPSAILKKSVVLTDSFYYARAFSKRTTGGWEEIKTTHSQQVFDPSVPTILLKLMDDVLSIELPYVYYSTNLVQREIRVDVYTTKGPLSMALAGLSGNDFQAEWVDHDIDDNGIYTAPLSVMNSLTIISTDIVSGGTLAPSFAERRRRMIENAEGDAVTPISDSQLATALAEVGFDSTKVIDNLTRRVYAASRAMPDHTDGDVTGGIETAILTMKAPFNDLIGRETVIDNGPRLTVMPETLYIEEDGLLNMVADGVRRSLIDLSPEKKVDTFQTDHYLYTPFHYVLDTIDDTFTVRPYFLTAPSIDVASYSSSNDTSGLMVTGSEARAIEKTATGYRLRVKTRSNDVWKTLRDDQTHVQLAIQPLNEVELVYVNGRQVAKDDDGERVYEFDIQTNWDIDQRHAITLTNFTMFENTPMVFDVPLKDTYSLIWSVNDYTIPGLMTSAVDEVIGRHLLPSNALGIYHETVIIRLGDELSGLWNSSRAVVGERRYQTYDEDVPLRHQSTGYTVDPNTGLPKIIEVDGVKQLQVEYRKGDVVYENGQPVIKYRKGEVKRDTNGNPILQSERGVVRWWDVVLFDAAFLFATREVDRTYVSQVPGVVVDWINDVLAGISRSALEQTRLYFQPRNSLRTIKALVDEGLEVNIFSAQQLKVSLYVDYEVYQNYDLRAEMERSIARTLAEQLNQPVVTRLAIEKALYDSTSDDLVSVSVEGLGGEANYSTISLMDDSSRLCIAKGLRQTSDGKLAITDLLEISFKRHAVK